MARSGLANLATRQQAPVPQPRSDLLLLGGFQVVRDGERVRLPLTCQRLVALLGIEGPRTRTTAAGTLWPQVTEEHAQGSLRSTIWRLNSVWPSAVRCEDHNLALAPEVRVDVGRWSAIARRLLSGAHGAGEDCLELVDALTADLLPGWDDDWVQFERERLRQLSLHSMEALATSLMEQGRCAVAIDVAMQAVRREPLRESAHYVAIGIHLAEGNLIEARRQYGRLGRLLRRELGVEPSLTIADLATSGRRRLNVPRQLPR